MAGGVGGLLFGTGHFAPVMTAEGFVADDEMAVVVVDEAELVTVGAQAFEIACPFVWGDGTGLRGRNVVVFLLKGVVKAVQGSHGARMLKRVGADCTVFCVDLGNGCVGFWVTIAAL